MKKKKSSKNRISDDNWKSLIEGYNFIPKDQWYSNLHNGDFIRYVKNNGDKMTGGQIENFFVHEGKNYVKLINQSIGKSWVVRLEDIREIWKKPTIQMQQQMQQMPQMQQMQQIPQMQQQTPQMQQQMQQMPQMQQQMQQPFEPNPIIQQTNNPLGTSSLEIEHSNLMFNYLSKKILDIEKSVSNLYSALPYIFSSIKELHKKKS